MYGNGAIFDNGKRWAIIKKKDQGNIVEGSLTEKIGLLMIASLVINCYIVIVMHDLFFLPFW